MKTSKRHQLLKIKNLILIIILTLAIIFRIKYMGNDGNFLDSLPNIEQIREILFDNKLYSSPYDPSDDTTTCVHVTDPDARDCRCRHVEVGFDWKIDDTDDRCHVCSGSGADISCDNCLCLFHEACLPEYSSLHEDGGDIPYEQVNSEQANSEQANSEQANSEQANSEQVNSEQANSGQANSEQEEEEE